MARLKDVCTINPKSPGFQDDFAVSFVPMPKVGENGEFDPSEVKTYQEVKKGFTYFQDGDVLFAKITPCMENGKGAIAQALKNGIGFGSTEFHVLRPLTDRVTSKWLYYLLSWQVFRKEAEKNMTGSAGQKRVPKSFLSEYVADISDVNTQKKMTDTLDKICDLISLRKQQLAKLDELVKARFVEMFDTCEDTVRLSDVADITGGLTKNSKRNKLNLKLPYLRVANVSFASIDVSEMLEIGLTEAERDKTILKYGDLLFVEGNGSPDQIGRVAIWRDEIIPCVHQNHLIKARIDHSKILPVFTMYYFMSQRGREQIKSKAVSTSGLYTLSTSKIAGFRLPAPPMVLQKQFASFVEQTDKSKLTIQQSLDKLEVLKKSLMQEYFGFEQV